MPFLSAANWGGQGLHPRGNFEGFMRAASKHKWLEAHGIEHWTHFYTDYGVKLQKRFFDHFLKGDDNGWENQPRVLLQVRHVDRFVERHENEWPIARTQWTKFYLNPSDHEPRARTGRRRQVGELRRTGRRRDFRFGAARREIEITGPLRGAALRVVSRRDADLFLVFRVFTPDLREVVFQGAIDPHTPIAQGWLRASHRKLD